MTETTGRVYIVGAGCGRADLITLRGAERIKSCDVLIYDDLIDEALLRLCPENAELIYMGKRSGSHSASQEEINRRIAEKALEGKTVCRLKGGDPFVFGRGGEEILALRKAGIPYEEVPGISSAIAIPAGAGIPVTHRGLSRSFHVITGHTADTPDGLPPELGTLAKLDGTLIFLMGLSRLEKIASGLVSAGMSGETPAAVISGGNSSRCVSVRGTLNNIAQKVAGQGIQTPAVIVVGGVAALELLPTLPKPLDGVKVGLTGTPAVSDRLEQALEALGAEVFCVQRSELCTLTPNRDIASLLAQGSGWIVFTSGNGVERFFELLRDARFDQRRLCAYRFAVIGAATGRVLAGHGYYADLMPECFTGESLSKALLCNAKPHESVLIFRSAQGSPLLYESLKEKLNVLDIHTYTTRSLQLAENRVPDYICFSSAGGVRAFFEENGTVPPKAKCVCIGSMTANALREHYSGSVLLSKDISADGLIEAILADHRS